MDGTEPKVFKIMDNSSYDYFSLCQICNISHIVDGEGMSKQTSHCACFTVSVIVSLKDLIPPFPEREAMLGEGEHPELSYL